MLRLRTTTALSLLTLIVGVAGTGWLSAQTAIWPAAAPAALAAAPARARRPVAALPSRARHHAAPVVVWHAAHAWAREDAVASAAPAAAPVLIPVSTPAAATPYERLRGHLDGSVLLQLAVDGRGRVSRAAVARSSGDPVLDQHALEMIEGWRFAVPPDHPDGLSGELPLRFDTGTSLARTP